MCDRRASSRVRVPLLLFLIASAPSIPFSCGLALPAACGLRPPRAGRIILMSYNALSLFDGHDDGGEYPEYSVARGLWSESSYRQRLDRLARVVREAGREVPDIIALQEIEGPTVAADLAALLRRDGFGSFGAGGGSSAIRCAILSRLPIISLRSHLPRGPGGDGERSILEALIDAGEGRRLLVLVNHWKSRREGAGLTEERRIASADLLASVIRARMDELPGVPILACGDFNEEAEAWERSGGSYPTAFARPFNGAEPASPPILLLSSQEWASGLGRETDALPLISPWIGMNGPDDWSYAWQEERERIDMILLEPESAAASGTWASGFAPSHAAFLLDEKGLPLPWDGKRGEGFSDHLPIFITLGSGG